MSGGVWVGDVAFLGQPEWSGWKNSSTGVEVYEFFMQMSGLSGSNSATKSI